MVLDNRHKRCAPFILNLNGEHIAFPLSHTENGCLGFGASALRPLNLLAFVLVGFPTTNIGFINLNLVFKDWGWLGKGSANFVEYKPSRFLCHTQVNCDMVSKIF